MINSRAALIIFISVSLLFVYSCGCPDYEDYGTESIVLELKIDMSNSYWNEILKTSDHNHYYSRDNSTDLDYESKNGLIINNNWVVDLNSKNIFEIPETYQECETMNSKRALLCTITEPLEVSNSYSDTDVTAQEGLSLLVEIKLDESAYSFKPVSIDTLEVRSANFISKNRYKISRIYKPSSEQETVFFQVSHQTREVVTDSSGAVINDFVFYQEIEQYKRTDSNVTLIASYGSVESTIEGLDFDHSNSSNVFVYSKNDTIYFVQEDGNTEKTAEGTLPEIFENDGYILFKNKDGGVSFFELQSKNVENLSDNNSIISLAIDENNDLLFYVNQDYDLISYDYQTQSKTILASLKSYILEREKSEGSGYYYDLINPKVFLDNENPELIRVISKGSYSIFIACG